MSSIRSQLVMELSKEIYGPREGPNETITSNPINEYLVGVLEPKESTRGSISYYGSADIKDEKSRGFEEEETGEEEQNLAVIGLQLGLPKTMGISFLVDGESPMISFCATWARYNKIQKDLWKRTPKKWFKYNIDVTKSDEWAVSDDTVRIALRSKLTPEGKHHVSIYLINETHLMDSNSVKVKDLVFQPQLRIVREGTTTFSRIIGEQLRDDEEASLSLLYLNKHAYARGHLCGAVWKDIDPERHWNGTSKNTVNSHPFVWIDAEILDESPRNKFLYPDLRTEFIPCYSIEQRPLLTLNESEEYDAENLAEIWEQTQITDFFEALVREYKNWIDLQKQKLESLKPEFQDIGRKHIRLCEDSLRRIIEGIAVLQNNKEARLSFCFMNKVMNLQSMWKPSNNRLKWRPFQIAFILQCLPSIVNGEHPDRQICDLLWFPTGGGKTEAYLGLGVFTLAYRRRVRFAEADGGAGTSIISRYTLRLLTTQQFRRALYVILACDLLRVRNWHPKACKIRQINMWGGARFSIGLWVGGEVSPNHLINKPFYSRARGKYGIALGAVGQLLPRETYKFQHVVRRSNGDPVQILNCPACDSILAVSPTNIIPNKDFWLHWIISSPNLPVLNKHSLGTSFLDVKDIVVKPLPSGNYFVISIKLRASCSISRLQIENWWKQKIKPALNARTKEEFAKPSLPGYFIRRGGIQKKPIDFEIHCANPECPLNKTEWFEKIPNTSYEHEEGIILKPFRIRGKEGFSFNVPISAYVVDAQVYARCPSFIVSTVDKFARLSYVSQAAAIFGNIDHYDDSWGYYPDLAPPDRGKICAGNIENVTGFKPPELIIQDELHLIEGPLGSMVGLYETAVDILSTDYVNGKIKKPKYVASSATIRRAHFQILAVFNRKTSQFPPPGIFIEDNFFVQRNEPHQLDSRNPGRLYLGICVPGKGPHTPIIRIWSALLQKAYQFRLQKGQQDVEVDQFWTLVGFFNSMRELGTTESLYKQDMVETIERISNRKTESPRSLSRIEMELSSRMNSEEIPYALNEIAKFPENTVDAVFATSMFGTGIDVDRLGLMVVHGQPKTTATYIQATGRVGRQMGGLVVTFLRATRPRDLDHYEFFNGYHRSLARFVEPITVYPFSPRARERAMGPFSVAILRNSKNILNVPVSPKWAVENDPKVKRKNLADFGPTRMRSEKNSNEIKKLLEIVETRAQNQPAQIKPKPDVCSNELDSDLDRWRSAASDDELVYYEQTFTKTPEYPVVLGDPQHKAQNKRTVFKNAPSSLRDVEAEATFGSG